MQTISSLNQKTKEQSSTPGSITAASTVAEPKASNKPKPARKKKLEWARILIRISAVLVAIVLWHLASTYKFNFIINFENIPTPETVWTQFVALLKTDIFYKHIYISIRRILIGFSLATFLGVIIGVIMGRFRLMTDIFMPYIEILRPIPAVAWIPLAILMFPTEESSIIYITFLGAFFPIVINTIHGVEQTPQE